MSKMVNRLDLEDEVKYMLISLMDTVEDPVMKNYIKECFINGEIQLKDLMDKFGLYVDA